MTRWLNRDVHFRNLGGKPGAASGFLMGFAFAFGWTPCIGPILASVLGVAATRDTVGQGVFLLACYSAGLAIPFLVTALGIGAIFAILSAVSPAPAHGGSIQRRAAAGASAGWCS